MATIINPSTGRSLEQETLVARLEWWMASHRVIKLAVENTDIPAVAFLMWPYFVNRMSDGARWLYTKKLLSHRLVRRAITSYEMKQGGLTRACAKVDINGLKSRADEFLATAHLRP